MDKLLEDIMLAIDEYNAEHCDYQTLENNIRELLEQEEIIFWE